MKVESIRVNIMPCTAFVNVDSPELDTLSLFIPVSLTETFNIVSHMKVSTCPLDIMPTKLLIDLTETVRPCLLSIFQQLPVSDYFKTVQPLLKKPGLDYMVLEN